ncbi:MAG: class I tRNA ligase family protein [Planctomycetota bacterium]
MSDGSNTKPHRYTAELANAIETRWQHRWEAEGTHRQPNPGEAGFDASRPKYFALDMFPYPSGAGLHVGHPEGFTASDIVARYKRMRGFNVLHAMGWDAFGLPAEQYAIQTGVHPAETTRKSIDNFRRQLKRFGFAYDWEREFGTIDEDYYAWTQWIFLKLYSSWFDPSGGGHTDRGEGDPAAPMGRAKPIEELEAQFAGGEREIRVNPQASETSDDDKARRWGDWASMSIDDRRLVLDSYRLAYIGRGSVNWCPKLGTALANEEVIDGKSERGGFPVLRKPLRQWMLRITAYAERLLGDLPLLDWPESTRTMQAEWIGRSEGAEVDFELADAPRGYTSGALRVYTTRPDTLFGATYMVVAPEHPLVDAVLREPLPSTDADAVRAYVEAARNRSDVERQEAKDKTGVATGVSAINPATGERIPVWTSDYVLMGYGTGAIMAVPAHDQRDYEFAEAFGLEIRDVVYPAALYPAWWLGTHASDAQLHAGDADEDGWLGPVADFIGYVTAHDLRPESYAEAWGMILARPRALSDPARAPEEREVFAGVSVADSPGGSGLRRGTVRMTWLEALGEMGFESVEQFRRRMRAPMRSKRLGEAYSDAGRAINSSNADELGDDPQRGGVSLNGLGTGDAKARMTAWLERSGHGRGKINYRLRDWLFSRQRYWGEPFPIVFDERGHHHAVGEGALPVALPPLSDYQPVESDDPQPLLAKAQDWVSTTAGQAGVPGLDPSERVERETNTMPGWAGSCWYYLRYTDPKNSERFSSRAAERYWMLGSRDGVDAGEADKFGTFEPHMHRVGGVDLYIGGSEHAVLHLLYARFWHKVLFDLGEVSTPEPFNKLFHQGLITSFAFQRKDRSLVPTDEVENRGSEEKPSWVETATGEAVTQITAKMSKSLKNVVNPDDIIAEFGADTFRLYEMYMGPLEASKPWNTRDTVGLFRFCQRAWRLCVDESTGEARVRTGEGDREIEKALHRTIDKVGSDIERLSFNTAIAALIEFVNKALPKDDGKGSADETALTLDQLGRFALALSPLAPHLAEEVWERAGLHAGGGPLIKHAWPEVDPKLLVDDEVEIPVQILGKVRSKIRVATGADAKSIEAQAMGDGRIVELLEGKTVRKVIVVPGRMVNIVAN